MPELPEVETVCRGLTQSLKGRVFTDITLRRKDLRIPFPANFAEILKGRKVKNIRRRAKYIIIELDSPQSVIAHLGMTGRMVVAPKKGFSAGKHDHAIITLDNSNILIYNDTRRFGLITLVNKDKIEAHPLIKNLGLEPLSGEFDGPALHQLLKGKNTSLKGALMDQALVVGVGNIYASEALFRAGISPLRPAGKVTLQEAGKLSAAIKKVLNMAIEAGGSSFSDYVSSSGEKGYFQHNFQVYSRAGKPCPNCGKNISKIRQIGRSSFYCTSCQR